MAVDLTDMTYKYTVNEDGTVTYVAGADGKSQNLSGRDTSSKGALEADLAEYTRAYVSGLALEYRPVGNDLTVGKQQSAAAPEA